MIRFYDASLNKEIPFVDFGNGRLKEEKTRTVVYMNDSKVLVVGLEFSTDNDEVSIVGGYKTELKAGEKAELQLKWTPRIKLVEGLVCRIGYKGDEIWGQRTNEARGK